MAVVVAPSSNWFLTAGKDQENDKLLKPASDVIRGRDQFRTRLRGILKTKGGNVNTATTKEDLEKQISTYQQDYSSLKNEALSALDGAAQANTKYQQDRQTGAKKVGRGAQRFVISFADFLKAYSGIVEILRGAGQIYGEVAYETLSILLIVFINKSTNDKSIADLLDELKRSFPRLDNWVGIYPTASMKASVADVYKEVIQFARGASIYFTRFSTRLWMAIGKPPSMGIDRNTALIHCKLAEVSSEANFLLHKRNQEINIIVKESQITITQSQATVEESYAKIQILQQMLENEKTQNEKFRRQQEVEKEHADQQNLETFKILLNITTFPTSPSSPDLCSTTLDQAFHPRRKRQYQHMTSDLLFGLPEYNAWLNAQESALILLSGQTDINSRTGRGFTHSWLSPATLHVTSSFREDGNTKVAYYSCHPGVRTDKEIEINLEKDMLTQLSYHLLEWQPSILRRKMQQMQNLIHNPLWEGVDTGTEGTLKRKKQHTSRSIEKAPLALWFSLLREILLEIKVEKPHGCVYLVLDRLDLVECRIGDFMDELKALVNHEVCFVKVFAVMDEVKGEWEAGLEDEKRVYFVQGLNQKKLGAFR